MMNEIAALEEQLAGCELALSQYKKNLGKDTLLDANYRHKQEQAARLRAQIDALKAKDKQTDG